AEGERKPAGREQDRSRPPGGQHESVAASIVIAEEEGDETAVAVLGIQAVAHQVIAAEPASEIESEHRQRGQRQADASAETPDRGPGGAGPEPGAAQIPEQRPLELGKSQVAEWSAENQSVEQWEAQLMIGHPGAGADHVAEIGVASKPGAPADVDPPRPVPVAVEPVEPRGKGGPPTEPKVVAEVPRQQEAVEPGIGEIAGQACRERQAGPVDRSGRDPQGIVPDEAHIVGADPADPVEVAGLGQVEIEPVGVLDDAGGVEPREPGERIADHPHEARRSLGVRGLKISLEDAAGGTKDTDAPVDAMRLVEVDDRRVEVLEERPDVASLEGTDARIEEVVAEEIAQQSRNTLGSTVAGRHGNATGGNIRSEE